MVGFEPTFLRGLEHLHRAHGQRLGRLTGKPLSTSAVVAHEHSGVWMADYPVVLRFGDEQVEIQHSRFDDLSISWNGIDTTAPIPGYVLKGYPEIPGLFEGEPAHLHDPVWTFDDERLAPFHGQALEEVALVQWRGEDAAHGMVSVEFIFGGVRVCVANGLDENTIEVGRNKRDPALSHRVVL